jgi:5-deoxy-glucuronate isomerase
VTSKLLVHPRRSADGIVHSITPRSAGWTYVGFETRELRSGTKAALHSGPMEVCVVMLTGKARIVSDAFDSGVVGERMSVFEGARYICPPA